MFERFDDSARRTLVHAEIGARARHQATVSTEDLLVALRSDPTTTAGRCLQAVGAGAEPLAAQLSRGDRERHGHLPLTADARAVVRAATELAADQGRPVSQLHLLTALIGHSDCGANRRLESLGIDTQWLRSLRREDGLLDVDAVERQWRQERLRW